MSRDPVPALAGLGIVFQQPTLDLELTVTANLLFHAGLHGMPRADRQGTHRQRARSSRSQRSRRRQDRRAQWRQPAPRRACARAAARAARAADGRADGRARSGEPQRPAQALADACAASARSPSCGRRICATKSPTPIASSCSTAARCWPTPHRRQLVASAGTSTIEEAFLAMTATAASPPRLCGAARCRRQRLRLAMSARSIPPNERADGGHGDRGGNSGAEMNTHAWQQPASDQRADHADAGYCRSARPKPRTMMPASHSGTGPRVRMTRRLSPA